jgi:hypothetical protein
MKLRCLILLLWVGCVQQKNPGANRATLEAFPAKFQPLESNPQLSGMTLLHVYLGADHSRCSVLVYANLHVVFYTNLTMALFFSTTGKFLLLDSLLKEIRKRTKDRIVIVSNYTQISYLASPLLSPSFPSSLSLQLFVDCALLLNLQS